MDIVYLVLTWMILAPLLASIAVISIGLLIGLLFTPFFVYSHYKSEKD